MKENLQADLDTKINLIENNFSKKENDFELDAEVGCKPWKMFEGQKKSFHLEAVAMFLCTNDSVVDDNDDDEMDVE